MQPCWLLALTFLLSLAGLVGADGLRQPLRLNPVHPLAQGLRHWWLAAPPFQAGPTWWPLVGQIPGTLTNMGADGGWAGTTRPGWTTAMTFDGVDDAVVLGTPSAFDFANTTFTLALRFRVASCTGSAYLVSKTENAVAGGWFLRLSAGFLRARIYSSGGESAGRETVTNTALCNNTFYSAVVVFTTDTVTAANNTVLLYINGVADNTGTLGTDGLPYSPYTAAPLTLGRVAIGGVGTIAGSLNDVRLWSRGLSASEALAYHRALPPTFDGLLTSMDLSYFLTPAAPPVPTVKRRISIQ